LIGALAAMISLEDDRTLGLGGGWPPTRKLLAVVFSEALSVKGTDELPRDL